MKDNKLKDENKKEKVKKSYRTPKRTKYKIILIRFQ
jgi:hypothetical protein